MHTQALMTSKACLSQPNSPAPVLGVPAPVSPAQRASSCSPPSLGLGRPGALGIVLPSFLYQRRLLQGLIPVGIGAIRSEPPSLLLCEELVSLAGAVGQEAPWQQQEQGSSLRWEALGMDRDAGPWQNQFSTNPGAAPQCF